MLLTYAMARPSSAAPILAAALLSAGLPFLTSCDKPAPAKSQAAKPPKPSAPAQEPLTKMQMELRFKTARVQLLNGKVAESMEGLTKLGARNDVPQPLLNWISLNEGLTLLMSAKVPEAQTKFAAIAERQWKGTTNAEIKLGEFFAKAGKLLSADGAVSTDEVRSFERSNHESIAILCAGIKNWALGQLDKAEPFLRYYSASRIEGLELWTGTEEEIDKLRVLAANIEESQMTFDIAMKELHAAKSPEEKKEAVERTKPAVAKLRYAPKLKEELDQLLAKIEPEALAAMAKMKADAASMEEFDAKAWPAAREKGLQLFAQFRFEEAHKAVLAPDLKLEKTKAEQDALAKKCQWLATFQEILTDDVKAKGYPGPVKRKGGPQISSPITKADEKLVYIKTEPPTSLAWGDIDNETIISMARSFIPEDLAPFLAAHRKWQLGVYCLYSGKKADAKPLFEAAAEGNPVYKDEIEPLLSGTFP